MQWNRMIFAAAAMVCVVWSIMVIIGGYWFWMPIAVAMTAAFGLTTRRMERLAIVADEDQLLVKNFWREYRFRRPDILSFAIEPTFMNRRQTIVVKLKDFTSISCNVMGPMSGEPTRTDIEECRLNLA